MRDEKQTDWGDVLIWVAMAMLLVGPILYGAALGLIDRVKAPCSESIR